MTHSPVQAIPAFSPRSPQEPVSLGVHLKSNVYITSHERARHTLRWSRFIWTACLESSVIATNDLVNQAVLLRLKRGHVPVSVSVLVDLDSSPECQHVPSCQEPQYPHYMALHEHVSRQHIMYSHLRKGTFSMGCPVHSDMILLRFALWYMISFACNAYHVS